MDRIGIATDMINVETLRNNAAVSEHPDETMKSDPLLLVTMANRDKTISAPV
jgi:hypothetical protein